jgi:hypothetical protein
MMRSPSIGGPASAVEAAANKFLQAGDIYSWRKADIICRCDHVCLWAVRGHQESVPRRRMFLE